MQDYEVLHIEGHTPIKMWAHGKAIFRLMRSAPATILLRGLDKEKAGKLRFRAVSFIGSQTFPKPFVLSEVAST